jgi:hypothetical protein
VTKRPIDYRCEDSKDIGELIDDVGAIRKVLTPSFRKTPTITPKNRTVQPGEHLKIQLSSRGLK